MRPFTEARLNSLLVRGREFNTFWRHDIDYSLDAALKMGHFEEERGISSTFYLFFRPHCPFYTPLEAEITAKKLEKLGHKIGEHIDERRVENFSLSVCEHVSFHCPTKNVLWKEFSHFTSAYEPHWEGKYVADSNGRFRYGDPEDKFDENTVIQVNLHPEWWFEHGWYHKPDRKTYIDFFYEPPPHFSDYRNGRPVKSGQPAVWAFDPRHTSPHCALWVSPEDYDAVMKRGYALIDGQKATPFMPDCDPKIGFLRLGFTAGPYQPPKETK